MITEIQCPKCYAFLNFDLISQDDNAYITDEVKCVDCGMIACFTFTVDWIEGGEVK